MTYGIKLAALAAFLAAAGVDAVGATPGPRRGPIPTTTTTTTTPAPPATRGLVTRGPTIHVKPGKEI
jgi:hypothetical protein